jgi:hypothetical protein
MQTADDHAERARKNGLLALSLVVVSLAVLGLMIAVVIGLRSGVLGRLVQHAIGAIEG